MAYPNFIRIDLGGGWFDQLIKEIDRNREFSLWLADNPDTSDESRHYFNCMAERDERVKVKLMNYTDSNCCAKLFRSELQDIFWILLENLTVVPEKEE